jgi:hypothetical protein
VSHDNDSGGEVTEILTDVYTAAQIQRILATVKWRSEAQSDEIARRVQKAGWWYEPYRRLLTEEGPPSKRKRRLNSVLKKLRAAKAVVLSLSKADLDHLEAAGINLAKRDGRLPDVHPEPVELPERPGQTEPEFMNVWDAARQIEASLERLDWLMRCVEQAIDRAVQETAEHGSPVADDALHTTIRVLHEVYFDRAANPRRPGADIGDDSAESHTHREGELLDFLKAALDPLDIQKTREAIYAVWRRAIKALPKT